MTSPRTPLAAVRTQVVLTMTKMMLAVMVVMTMKLAMTALITTAMTSTIIMAQVLVQALELELALLPCGTMVVSEAEAEVQLDNCNPLALAPVLL